VTDELDHAPQAATLQYMKRQRPSAKHEESLYSKGLLIGFMRRSALDFSCHTNDVRRK
jgi:hypothetical protein